jgi:hypothetical protein
MNAQEERISTLSGYIFSTYQGLFNLISPFLIMEQTPGNGIVLFRE